MAAGDGDGVDAGGREWAEEIVVSRLVSVWLGLDGLGRGIGSAANWFLFIIDSQRVS